MDEIIDAPREQQRFAYAGFWIRFAAYFIDAILLGLLNAVVSLVMTGGFDPFTPNLTVSLINIVTAVVYFMVMESSEKQATIGKMAVGIKVGDVNGERLSLPNALGRYLAKYLSALTLLIGFIMVAWDDKKQGLHDKLANTYVFYA